MQDPIRQLLGWYDHHRDDLERANDHELIEYRDRVTFAVSLIRDHELRLWFEADWAAAELIARLVPECAVFSVPSGARWVDDLDLPPPWRRARHRGPQV